MVWHLHLSQPHLGMMQTQRRLNQGSRWNSVLEEVLISVSWRRCLPHWYYFALICLLTQPCLPHVPGCLFWKTEECVFFFFFFLYSEDLLFSRYFQVSPALRCLGDLKVHRPSWSSPRGRKAVNTIHAESNIKAKGSSLSYLNSTKKASNTAASDLSISAWWWGTRWHWRSWLHPRRGKSLHVIRATIKMGLDKVIERGSAFAMFRTNSMDFLPCLQQGSALLWWPATPFGSEFKGSQLYRAKKEPAEQWGFSLERVLQTKVGFYFEQDPFIWQIACWSRATHHCHAHSAGHTSSCSHA